MLADGERGLFVKLGQRRAQAISVVHLAVVVGREGDGPDAPVTRASLALGSVAPTVVGATAAEERLVGGPLDDRRRSRTRPPWPRRASPPSTTSAPPRPTDRRRSRRWSAAPSWRCATARSAPVGRGARSTSAARPCPPVRVVADGHDDATPVECTVNGAAVAAAGGAGVTLLDWLRDEVGLTGTKEGCAEGECGACTVHLDGVAVLSCLVPAARAHGAAVTTIEGLAAADGQLHPLQQAFVDQFAVQCGFCIPGFLMSGDRLLQECPHPTRDGRGARAVGQPLPLHGLLPLLRRRRAGGGHAAVTRTADAAASATASARRPSAVDATARRRGQGDGGGPLPGRPPRDRGAPRPASSSAAAPTPACWPWTCGRRRPRPGCWPSSPPRTCPSTSTA